MGVAKRLNTMRNGHGKWSSFVHGWLVNQVFGRGFKVLFQGRTNHHGCLSLDRPGKDISRLLTPFGPHICRSVGMVWGGLAGAAVLCPSQLRRVWVLLLGPKASRRLVREAYDVRVFATDGSGRVPLRQAPLAAPRARWEATDVMCDGVKEVDSQTGSSRTLEV